MSETADTPEKGYTHVWQLLDEIGILFTHILRIPAKYPDTTTVKLVNLCALAVVLVFTRESLVLEAIKDFANSLRRLGKHRLEGYTGCKLACRTKIVDTMSKESRNDDIIVRKFTSRR